MRLILNLNSTSNELQTIIDKLNELNEKQNEKEIASFSAFIHNIWFKCFVVNDERENNYSHPGQDMTAHKN